MKKQLLLFSLCLLAYLATYAQTITINDGSGSGCFNNDVLTNNGTTSSPTRNIYTGSSSGAAGLTLGVPANARVLWVSGSNRWEVQIFNSFTNSWITTHYNTTATAPLAPALSLGTWVKTGSGCSDLTTFTGTGTTITLPIELATFTANTEGGKNTLTWATGNELNSQSFNIERSRDGETFQIIGTVKAQGKAATYAFTDAEPINGTNYYRLRQIDFDGTVTYSKVVSVANKGSKSLKVYPTLISNGFLTLVIARDEATEGSDYAIYNIVGQQVQNGKTAQRLDVSALAKGTYILKVGTEQAKFVKQ